MAKEKKQNTAKEPEKKEAEEKFKDINEAYEVLSDKNLERLYNENQARLIKLQEGFEPYFKDIAIAISISFISSFDNVVI